MPITPNEQLEILSVCEASRITKLDRGKLAQAMNLWQQTGGRHGLAFVQPYGRRRMLRRSTLRDWFERQEAQARYGY